MRRSVVLVGEHLVIVPKVGRRLVPVVSEAVEGVNVLAHLPVQFARGRGIAERREEASRKLVEGSRHDDGLECVLLHSLGVDEEEQLVLDNWTAHTAAKIVPLVVAGLAPWKGSSTGIPATEIIEGLAVQRVGARPRGHVNGARRGKLGREVKT